MTGDLPDAASGWPVTWRGVVETLGSTFGPNGRWNIAPLGLRWGEPVTATTWGRTRTRRNLDRTASCVIQFPTDPVVFVDAALSIVERDEPVVADAAAWVRVDAEAIETGTEHDTEWKRWELTPVETEVIAPTVPTLSRATGAVVEASVAASRFDVTGYDDRHGYEIIAWAGTVVDRAGGPRERLAYERLVDHADLDRSELDARRLAFESNPSEADPHE